jgi:hypothetical protein
MFEGKSKNELYYSDEMSVSENLSKTYLCYYSMGGYMVSKTGAKKVLEDIKKYGVRDTIDNFIVSKKEPNIDELNVYTLKPGVFPYCQLIGDNSTIIVDYSLPENGFYYPNKEKQ